MPRHPKSSRNGKNTKNISESSDSSDDEKTLPVSDESDEDEFAIDPDIAPTTDEIIYGGLVMKDDYVLLKKIGHGNNAGVWMVYNISKKLYMAMKIQDFQCFEDGCREVAIIKKINQYSAKYKNRETHCIKMLDYFIYEECPEVKFVCTVYDLYAGSLQMVLMNGKYKYGLPISVVKNIARQLVEAVIILHNDLHIIHTDLKPENILFKGIPKSHTKVIECFNATGFAEKYEQYQSDKMDKDTFYDKVDLLALECAKELDCITDLFETNPPDSESDDDFNEDDIIEGEDDFSEESYDSDEFYDEPGHKFNTRNQSVDDLQEHLDCKGTFDIESIYEYNKVLNNRLTSSDKVNVIDDSYLNNCMIAVTDFGNSYFYEKRTRNEIQDRFYRAPEIILDLNYGYPCDIWSIGCIVFELLTGYPLFEPEAEPLTVDIHHLFLMEKMFGPMPLQMKKRSRRRKFLFDIKNNYRIKNIKSFEILPLRDRLIKQFLFSEHDATEITDFLAPIFRYDPKERVTLKNILVHPWLKE